MPLNNLGIYSLSKQIFFLRRHFFLLFCKSVPVFTIHNSYLTFLTKITTIEQL